MAETGDYGESFEYGRIHTANPALTSAMSPKSWERGGKGSGNPASWVSISSQLSWRTAVWKWPMNLHSQQQSWKPHLPSFLVVTNHKSMISTTNFICVYSTFEGNGEFGAWVLLWEILSQLTRASLFGVANEIPQNLLPRYFHEAIVEHCWVRTQASVELKPHKGISLQLMASHPQYSSDDEMANIPN